MSARAADSRAPDYRLEMLEQAQAEVEAHYQQEKALLLSAAACGQLPIEDLAPALARTARLRRIAERATKAGRRLQAIAEAQ